MRLFFVYQSIKINYALFNIDCSTSPVRLHSTSVAVLRCVSCSFPWMTFAASASWRGSTRVSPSTGVVPRRVLQRSKCCTTRRTYDSCCTNLSYGHFVITRWIYIEPIRFLGLNYICIYSPFRSLPKNPDAIVLSKIFAIWNVAWLCSQRSSWITLSKSVIPHSSMPSRIWMIVWRFCFCSAHFPHCIWYHVNSRIFAVDWLLNFCTISLPRSRCARYSYRSRDTISRQRSRDRRSHGLCHITIRSSRNRARRLISKSCPFL